MIFLRNYFIFLNISFNIPQDYIENYEYLIIFSMNTLLQMEINVISKVTKKKDLSTLLDLTIEAFENAPNIHYLFPEKSKRKKHMYHFYRFRLHYGFNFGEIYTIDLKSYIIKTNTSLKMTIPKIVKSKGILFPWIYRDGTYARMKAFSEELKNNLPAREAEKSVIYLLATRKDHERKGYATALMNLVLKDCSGKIYVDVTSAENVRFYEKFGFEVIGKIEDTFSFTYYRMVKV